MDSTARIAFSNDLIDLKQPASIQILESTPGTFQLCLTLGIKAKTVPVPDPFNPATKESSRDALVNTEMFLKGKANIGLKAISADEKTATISIALDGTVDTKVPGTGDGAELIKLNLDMFEFVAVGDK